MARFTTTPGSLASKGFNLPQPSAAIIEQLANLNSPGVELPKIVDAAAGTADPDLALVGCFEICQKSPKLLAEILENENWWQKTISVLGTSQALNRYLAANVDALAILAEDPLEKNADIHNQKQPPTLTGGGDAVEHDSHFGASLEGVNQYLRSEIASAIGIDDPNLLGVIPANDPKAADKLRLENRRQLTRIAGYDLTHDSANNLEFVTYQLSALADAILEAALSIAKAQTPGHEKVRLAVIAMGKCGAQELNYISDVDVIFVAEPATENVPQSSALAIATRLASCLVRVCSSTSAAGSIWAVDPSLRPEGKSGPLVRTLAAMETYYKNWALNWEFQALLKARTAAGDKQLGDQFCQLVAPMVWQAGSRQNFVADAQALRQRVISLLPADEATTDVKQCAGGLRDVEFSVQLLQLVHGRADERLRIPSTLGGLKSLVDHGYIGRVDGGELDEAYRFERVLEHRIQLYHLRRGRVIPTSGEHLRRLSRSMSMSSEKELLNSWYATSRKVTRLHKRVFYSPVLEAVSLIPSEELKLSTQAAQTRLEALNFSDPAAALRHIGALTKGITRRSEIQRQLLPAMLGWFAKGANPDSGLLSFRQLSESLGDSPWYLRALRDEGQMAQRLGHILSGSRYAVNLLQRAPDAVQILADDADLIPKDRCDLLQTMNQVVSRHDDPAQAITALRAVRGREILRICLGATLGLTDLEAVGVGLSELTSAAIEAGLKVAARQEGESASTAEAGVSVIAMGRWGGNEMGFSSDADAIFVVASDDEVKPAMAQVAKLRKYFTQPGVDPTLPIDADLRPEGKDGALVRTLSSYQAYYERWYSTWESQALLRASYGAGDLDVADAFLAIADRIRYPENGIGSKELAEIRKLKIRVDAERQPKGIDPARNTKLGPGGLSDVEWSVQLIQLRHAHEIPELKTTSTLKALQVEAEHGLVTEQEAQILRQAWQLASRIRNAIMLVRARPSDAIPLDARDVDAIGHLLGYQGKSSSAVLDDYLRATRRASKVVQKLFWEDTP